MLYVAKNGASAVLGNGAFPLSCDDQESTVRRRMLVKMIRSCL